MRWKPDSPVAAWSLFIVFTNMLHNMQHVCEHDIKSSALPEASYIRWMDDRVSPMIYTSYAVAHPKGNFASGRAEDSCLFHKEFSRSENSL